MTVVGSARQPGGRRDGDGGAKRLRALLLAEERRASRGRRWRGLGRTQSPQAITDAGVGPPLLREGPTGWSDSLLPNRCAHLVGVARTCRTRGSGVSAVGQHRACQRPSIRDLAVQLAVHAVRVTYWPPQASGRTPGPRAVRAVGANPVSAWTRAGRSNDSVATTERAPTGAWHALAMRRRHLLQPAAAGEQCLVTADADRRCKASGRKSELHATSTRSPAAAAVAPTSGDAPPRPPMPGCPP